MCGNVVQFEVFPTVVHLRKGEADQSQRRFFKMMVQRDLFGCAVLIIASGRVGTNGYEKLEHHADEGSAISALLSIAQRKQRCGYHL